jgi:predicted Ser/Thr protein kinase
MITCQYCGAKNPAGASFCDGCGAALTTSAVAQAQATAQAQVAAAHAARAQATAKQSAIHANPQFSTGRLPPQTMLRKQYLVLRTIGRGGMAAVYQASDTRSNRVVAIKEMSQEDLTPDEAREARDSFRREAGLLQKLNHPNLPHVFTDFSENGRNYLVMDFIDGETLEQKLTAAKSPLPEAEALGWARQLCDALSYLHRQQPPIIFRDLKPANVMVTKKGEVKLIDFGIARIFSPRQTRDTQALGTPGYAPPEQYGNAQTDARADIYALGATLYHLLTNYDVGRTPFALPPLRSRNPAISERTAAAIERATRLDREQRYRDIGEFARDLGVAAKAGAQSARAGQGQQGQQQARPTAGQAGAQAGANQRAGAGAKGATGRQGQRGVVGATMETAVRAATAGALAAGAAVIQSQIHPQATTKSPVVAFRDAAIAAARTATGPSIALTVQPREIDMNQLRAGQDGAATLTISGPNGAPVSGSLKPLAPWLHLDRTQFSGASSLIQVTARTSEMHGTGPQRGTIEVAIGNQRMYIPVRVDVIAAPVAAAPRPQPQPPNAAPAAPPLASARAARPGAQAAPGGGRGGGRGPAQQTAAHAAAPRQPRASASAAVIGRAHSLGGVRLALSLALALLFAFGLPSLVNAFALPQLTAALSALSSPVWVAWALLGVGVIGALIGAPLAYLGAARAPGRLRTGTLLAGVGALLAVTNAAQLHLTTGLTNLLPGAAQVGALALTLPLLVGVGAALGAQPLVSRGILAIARYIAAHYRLVLLTAAIVGGWLGLTAAQMALSAVFQQAPLAISLVSGCGLIVGVALGLMLATPVGYLVRRFAFG